MLPIAQSGMAQPSVLIGIAAIVLVLTLFLYDLVS